MLVLSRKIGESILIGENIRLTVSAISGSRVKICVDAPRELAVRREEMAPLSAVSTRSYAMAAPGR